MDSASLTRRGLLSAAAAGAAAVAAGPLLAGCSTSTSGQGSSANAQTLKKVLPNYQPVTYVKPDIPGVNGSVPGYLRFPAHPVRSVLRKPGSGGRYTAMTPAWWALPPGPGSNSYYKAVNAALGATLTFNILDGNDYAAKLQAILAAKDIPDWVCIPSWTIPANFDQAVDALFADLTPYLHGDKISDYPNLANIPTGAWQRSVFRDKLHALPFPSDPLDNPIFYRKDLFDQLGVEPPTSADELYDLAKKITDTRAKRWAVGDMYIGIERMFGCWGRTPGWNTDSKGNLVHVYETDAFAQATEFNRKLFAAGVVHPNAVAASMENGDSQAKQDFESGHMLMYVDGSGSWHEAVSRNAPINPKFDMQAMTPFGATSGTPVVYYAADPAGIYSFINKNAKPAAIEEMLRIANYVAAPFGTEEYQLIAYGVQGTDYTLNAANVPTSTATGTKEVTFTYGFLVQPPPASAWVQYPQLVKDYSAWEQATVQHLRKTVTYGMTITEPVAYANAHKPLDDTVVDITRGRKPMSALKPAIAAWRKAGGDKLRAFYTKALQDAGRL
jgi:putative aldouronate transport system substrate-binding protein